MDCETNDCNREKMTCKGCYYNEKNENKNITNFAELGKYLKIRIENVKTSYETLVKPYRTEYGINVSLMTRKEKEEFINKRNCLIVQQHCYQEILNQISLNK